MHNSCGFIHKLNRKIVTQQTKRGNIKCAFWGFESPAIKHRSLNHCTIKALLLFILLLQL